MKLITWLFTGCRHKNLSRPWTLKVRGKNDSYKVCLDCGRHIPFDLENWRAA